MTKASERRQKIRVPVQSTIRHSQYQVLGTPVFQENSSIDLSSGGISFETEREYKNGNLVLLEVEVNGEKLKLLVCVAWVKTVRGTTSYQVGAELIAIDPVDKRRMQKHLNSMLDAFEKAEPMTMQKSKSKKKATKKKTAKKKTSPKKAVSKKSKSKTAKSKKK